MKKRIRKIPEMCKVCGYRNKVKAINHSNARYKGLFKEKAYICQKLRMELRVQRNHLKKVKKKIDWLMNETDKALKKYRW